MKIFPALNDYWHYDDKMAQSFIFQKLEIPTPKTFVFYNKLEALNFIKTLQDFPIIYKASSGAGSSNVGLLNNKWKAKRYIKKAFGKGIETFFKEDLQRHYVYFQEFLKNNEGDFRIVCYGKDRMFGFFRRNKPSQKFASGSGIIDYGNIPEDILLLVYNTHKKLNYPTVMSYDILKDNEGRWVIGEMSVIFGDLKSKVIYEKSPHYLYSDNKFEKIENPDDIQMFFIKSLLNEWGWIE
jgi:biotin carboxylase